MLASTSRQHTEYINIDIASQGSKFVNSGIYLAIRQCNLVQLHKCIKYGESVSLTDDEFGTTFLLLVVQCADQATESRYVPFIYELGLAGINPNMSDYNQTTPLEAAVRSNLEDIMVALLRIGSEGDDDIRFLIQAHAGPFQVQTLKWYDKHTPSLRQAILNEDMRKVKRLIFFWHRINVKHEGQGLVQLAIKLYGREHIISDSLKMSFNNMEFAHAVMAGNQSKVEDMIESHQCDLHIVDRSYQMDIHSPLYPRSLYETAKSLQHVHLLRFLPRNVNAAAVSVNSNQHGVRGNDPRTQTQSVACNIL